MRAKLRLRHVKTQLISGRLRGAKHDILLGSHLEVLLVLLLVGVVGELAQVHGQRIVVGVEQRRRLLIAVIRRRTSVLRTASVRRTDTIAARRGGLLHLARRVSATVLAKVDLELSVVISATNGLDGLDSIRNVGKVDKGAALLT